MGRNITVTYIGVFIEVQTENIDALFSDDNFYDKYIETEIFRSPDNGGDRTQKALIPMGSEYAIVDTANEPFQEFVELDLENRLELLKEVSEGHLRETLDNLINEFRSKGFGFTLQVGALNYIDEIA